MKHEHHKTAATQTIYHQLTKNKNFKHKSKQIYKTQKYNKHQIKQTETTPNTQKCKQHTQQNTIKQTQKYT